MTAKHTTRTQAAYMDFQTECWDECVKLFYNDGQGDLLIKPDIEKEPMVQLFKQYFRKSWMYLGTLCAKKANAETDNEN